MVNVLRRVLFFACVFFWGRGCAGAMVVDVLRRTVFFTQ